MSLFGHLFHWTSPPADAGSPARCVARGSNTAPPPSYSFEKLQNLYFQLSQFRESDLDNNCDGDALIEIVRQITEALVWGEQTNHSQFFDFFCEKSIFSDLVHVLSLKKASKKVKLQLLQTLSMLIQNINRKTSVYYILSNNHVNRLMSTNMDFDDEDVLAYYITLMKSLAMRLDNESIKFFFIQHPEPSFPLYIEATKFFSHRDHMVRATVRTITLQVYKIEDPPMRRFVLRHAAESYFSQLAYHLQDLWLRLDTAAAKVVGEENLSAVQRENELQQDLQIYLSDVFELGIEALNEVLADRLLNAAILPVLLAGLITTPSPQTSSTARTLSPHVSLFLIRQVLDTFHCPVLLEPMMQALLWASVPAALAYVLPGQTTNTSNGADYVRNPLQENFMAALQSAEDRTFLMAASVLHSCIVKRRIFSNEFLETAQLLPTTSSKSSPSRPKATTTSEALSEPLSVVLQALPDRTTWQPKPYMAFVRMLLEVVHAEDMPSSVHAAAQKAASAATQKAASQVLKVLQEAQAGEDGGAWIVDIFCEEWEQHKAGLPHLPEFFADPRRLAPPEGGRSTGVGRRPSMQRSGIGITAQHAVRSLLMCRRLLNSLPGALQQAEEQSGGPQWLRYSDEQLPIQLPVEEACGRLREGGVVSLSDYTRVGCSLPSKKAHRQLLLDPNWLVLAEVEGAGSTTAVVTTVWPIWQVQSLIDRSDPRTLQIGMNAHKPGMRPGEAVAYNPPISTYFTLTLNFDDLKKCNEAAVHLQSRRLGVRSQMLQKAAKFVDQCYAGQAVDSDHDAPVALESIATSVF